MKRITTIVTMISISIIVMPVSGQWVKNIIGENLTWTAGLASGDIDGDGDVDIATTVSKTLNTPGDEDVVWYENDVTGWTKHFVDTVVGGVGIVIEDFDGDGKQDIAISGWSTNTVKWYKNEGGSPIQWKPDTIDASLLMAEWIEVADLDNDSDPDVIATGYQADVVVWYRNNGGTSINWTKDTIGANLGGALICQAGDIDGDNMTDVIATGATTNDIILYKNENNGESWTKYIIDANLPGASVARVADLDNDNDADVIATGTSANDVVWYENDGGTPVSWAKHTIDGNLGGAFDVAIADFNGDGTLDVVASANASGDVVWYSNLGNSPISWSKFVIDADLLNAWSIITDNINEDTYPDIITNQWRENGSVLLYLNPGGVGIEKIENNSSIRSYPNPVNDLLTIETEVPGLYRVEIFSLNGQLIYEGNMEGNTGHIELSTLREGIYFITIESQDMVTTGKIIKVR